MKNKLDEKTKELRWARRKGQAREKDFKVREGLARRRAPSGRRAPAPTRDLRVDRRSVSPLSALRLVHTVLVPFESRCEECVGVSVALSWALPRGKRKPNHEPEVQSAPPHVPLP